MPETRVNVQRPTSNVQRPRPEGRPVADVLEERQLNDAAEVVGVGERSPHPRPANHVSHRLLRSGTAPLPNHGEAQTTESRDDFIHKLGICLRALRESPRWRLPIQRVPLVKDLSIVGPLLGETEALIKMFARSIRTAKSSQLNVGRGKFKLSY
ncbi:MAG TPA: four helix bundle protein [Candidatus Limnocylindria bacterium]|jgi:four helix bundle protein|nr:four helix bundle protein [Candidatus Limnocylindria bacterium]